MEETVRDCQETSLLRRSSLAPNGDAKGAGAGSNREDLQSIYIYMINVNVHAVEFLPEKHRLTLLMDKSTCFCMLVRVFFYGAALFSSVAWGSSDKPKKTCLANPRRDLEIKFPGKRSYKHWGNVYPTKKLV